MSTLSTLGYTASSLMSSMMAVSSILRYSADVYAGRVAEEVAKNDLYVGAFVMVPTAFISCALSLYGARSRGKSLI